MNKKEDTKPTGLPALVYTVNEAIQITKLSRTTLWKLIKEGKIKKLPGLGKRVIIARDELYRFTGNTEQVAT